MCRTTWCPPCFRRTSSRGDPGGEAATTARNAHAEPGADFTDRLHQIVSNGLFTQDYGGGGTLVGTFSGNATATSATSAAATLIIPFIGGAGVLSDMIVGSGTATLTGQFVSANPDQSQNFTYALSLVGSLEVVQEPSSLALLVSGLVAAAVFSGGTQATARKGRREHP